MRGLHHHLKRLVGAVMQQETNVAAVMMRRDDKLDTMLTNVLAQSQKTGIICP